MLDQVRELAEAAGRETLRFFRQDFELEAKADDSPLTSADRASHELLVARLPALGEGWPVLSEESSAAEQAGRLGWERYWLVDPLDGTKEFVKGTGEFTVNVALIEGGRPVLGVVHHPPGGVTFAAARGQGAWRFAEPGASSGNCLRVADADPEALRLVLSASHASPAMLAYLEGRAGWSLRQAGSSLKFCLVAAGEADLYPRLGTTMEWDTAAAQCVVEEAGGQVLAVPDGVPVRYSKPVLQNPHMVTVGDPGIDWRAILAAAQGAP